MTLETSGQCLMGLTLQFKDTVVQNKRTVGFSNFSNTTVECLAIDLYCCATIINIHIVK